MLIRNIWMVPRGLVRGCGLGVASSDFPKHLWVRWVTLYLKLLPHSLQTYGITPVWIRLKNRKEMCIVLCAKKTDKLKLIISIYQQLSNAPLFLKCKLQKWVLTFIFYKKWLFFQNSLLISWATQPGEMHIKKWSIFYRLKSRV